MNRGKDIKVDGIIVGCVPVSSSFNAYFEGIETINADRWIVAGSEIDIEFDMGPI